MSNYHLKDTGLTLKAKGLLSMMLSCRMVELHHAGPGLHHKESVERLLKTLREPGSAESTRRQLQGKNGRITDTEYTIFEKPVKPQPRPAHESQLLGTENRIWSKSDMETRIWLYQIRKTRRN